MGPVRSPPGMVASSLALMRWTVLIFLHSKSDTRLGEGRIKHLTDRAQKESGLEKKLTEHFGAAFVQRFYLKW